MQPRIAKSGVTIFFMDSRIEHSHFQASPKDGKDGCRYRGKKTIDPLMVAPSVRWIRPSLAVSPLACVPSTIDVRPRSVPLSHQTFPSSLLVRSSIELTCHGFASPSLPLPFVPQRHRAFE